jgi:TPR repeat protein
VRKGSEFYHEALKWIFRSESNLSERLGGSDYDLGAFISQHDSLLDWLREDAVKENDKSMYYLGRILLKQGDKDEGMILINKAEEKGYSSAIYYVHKPRMKKLLKSMLPPDEASALIDKYANLVRLGHRNALYELGEFTRNKKPEAAIKYFEAAAMRGHITSMSMLVSCCLQQGASKDLLIQGMSWQIVCYYIGRIHDNSGLCEKYENLLSRTDQQQAIRLADEYMEKYVLPNCIKDEEWVYGLKA